MWTVTFILKNRRGRKESRKLVTWSLLKRKNWIFIFKDKNMNQNQACFTQ